MNRICALGIHGFVQRILSSWSQLCDTLGVWASYSFIKLNLIFPLQPPYSTSATCTVQYSLLVVKHYIWSYFLVWNELILYDYQIMEFLTLLAGYFGILTIITVIYLSGCGGKTGQRLEERLERVSWTIVNLLHNVIKVDHLKLILDVLYIVTFTLQHSDSLL